VAELATGERLQTKYGTDKDGMRGRLMVGNLVLDWIAACSPGTVVRANDNAQGEFFFTFEPPLDNLNDLRRFIREYNHQVSIEPNYTGPHAPASSASKIPEADNTIDFFDEELAW
jgi:hypothetical protein